MTVVILGGGIGGLSTAYYLLKSQAHKVVIVEASNRVGGWIRSEKQPSGVIFEQGPRTLRPVGEAGANTLNLIQDLGIAGNIRSITSCMPAAKNRYVYTDGKLYALPTGLKSMFCATPPFKKPLISALWHDFRAVPKYVHDDSIYKFVERRFGKELADYLISSLICGICGGDAKKISVKFLLSNFFQKEQEYGSVVKYYLRPWNWKLFGKYNLKELGSITFNTRWEQDFLRWIKDKKYKNVKLKPVRTKNLATVAKKQKWSSYSFNEGLEILPEALKVNLEEAGVKFVMNSKPVKLDLRERYLVTEKDNIAFDYVVGALPPYSLAPLLYEDNFTLSKQLSEIPYTSIITVNLVYKKKLLNMEGFGFLVPPSENLPILGVIFDHSYAPVQDWTILTVMMGGHAFDRFFKHDCSEDHLLHTATKNVAKILNINQTPDEFRISVLRNCIPQQLVNHNSRITWIMNHLELEKLPLFLVGNAYKGTGINDVILSAKGTVKAIGNYQNSLQSSATPRYVIDYL